MKSKIEQLIFYAEDEGEIAESVKENAQKVIGLCDERLEDLRIIQAFPHTPAILESVDSTTVLDVHFLTEVKKLTDKMYAAIVRSESSLWSTHSDTDPEFLASVREVKSSNAKADIIDGCIVVHFPLLASRYAYRSFGRASAAQNSRAYPINYGHIYSQDIYNVISKFVKELPLERLDAFYKKTVTFFSVYPASESVYLDSDSHDTKAAIDAVTDWLPGHDDAENCDFAFKTVLTDAIAAGSYIVVAPGRDAEIRATELIKMVRILKKQSKKESTETDEKSE